MTLIEWADRARKATTTAQISIISIFTRQIFACVLLLYIGHSHCVRFLAFPSTTIATRLLLYKCGYTRKKNAERTFQQQHHLFVSVARACRRRECGLTIRQMYILFVVMIWQSNEIFSLRCCCWFRLPNEIQRHSLEMGELSFTPQSHITQSRFQSLFFLSFDSIHRLLYEMRFKMAWEGFNIDTNV